MFLKIEAVCALVLFCGLILFYADFTDADFADKVIMEDNSLSAATLALSSISTVDEEQMRYLFRLEGLRSDGFGVSSLRIKNSGKFNTSYKLEVGKYKGSKLLCKSLNVLAFQKEKNIFNGNLLDLSLVGDFSKANFSDWIFILRLDSKDKLEKLKGKFCEFDLIVKSRKDKKSQRLFDRKILSNFVSIES